MKVAILKWLVIVAILAGIIIGMISAGNYIFDDPHNRQAWVKPGISQDEIPAGIYGSIVFKNVNVIPMYEEKILERQTVVIKDQSILDIGSSMDIDIPSDAFIIDGEGRFLIPGLSDMMTHTSGSENDLLLYLANGVTTIRIMGNDPPEVLEWRDQIKNGERAGPNMWIWWPQIQNNNVWPELEYEEATKGGKTWVHSTEEAEQLVAEMAGKGVDGIKPHVVFSLDIYKALLESADKHGLPFDGHAPDSIVQRWLTASSVSPDMSESWNQFRNLGVPALTHIEELTKMVSFSDESTRQASEDSINQIAQETAEDGMWITTTIHPFRSWGDLAVDFEVTISKTPETKYIHPHVLNTWGWSGTTYSSLGSRPWHSNYLNAQEKMLIALDDAGVQIMSGTDAAVPMMVPGFSLHDELETMVNAGLSPYNVLRTSTYNPALYLNQLEIFGTIEEAKRADLVLLEGNPLDDITNTKQITGTMVRGRWYSRADLDIMLEKVAKDYEGFETVQTLYKIAFWIAIALLSVGVIWCIFSLVRHRKLI